MEPLLVIEDFLRRCRIRLMTFELLAGFGWLGAWSGLIILGAFLLRPLAGAPLRGLWFLGAVVIFFLFLVRPGWRYRRLPRVAREAEARLSDRQRLEWCSALQLNPPYAGISPELVRLHQEKVATVLQAADRRRLVGLSRLRLPAASLLTVLAGVTAAGWYDPPTLARAASLLVLTQEKPQTSGPSWVGDISLHIEYPPYCGRPPRDVEGSDGTIRALAGSRVAIRARPDRPVREGAVLLSQSRLPLQLVQPELRAELVLEQNDTWRFELTAVGGQRWREPQGHPIWIEPDLAPKVELLDPPADRQVRADEILRLEYQASDDFGLKEARLVYRVEGRTEGEQRRLLWQSASPLRRLFRTAQFDLAPLMLGPDEKLQLFVEVLDNDTVNGPKTGRSAARSLVVFSPEKQRLELLRLAQQAWEELLLHLADALDLAAEEGKNAEPAAFERLREGGRRLLGTLSGLSKGFSQSESALEKLSAAFANLEHHLRQLDSSLAGLLQRADKRPSMASAALSEHRQRRVATLEMDVLYLEALLDLLRLEEMERLATRMRTARDRLEELLREYAQAPSEEVRRRLEAEIAELKRVISELARRQREVLKGVQDQYLNPEALSRLLEEGNLEGTLDKLQEALHQGRLQDALAELERLRGQLSQLEEQLQRSRSRLAGGRWRELAEQMARLAGELGQIAAEQERLLQQTHETEQKLLETYLQRSSGQLEQAFARLQKKLKRVMRQLDRLPDRPEWSLSMDLLEQSRQNARLLEQALQQLDAQAARDSAHRLRESTSHLASRPGPAGLEEDPDAPEPARLAARESQAILRELEKLLPNEEELAGEHERGLLGALSQRQRRLEERLNELRRQAEKLGQQAPLFAPGQLGRLSASGREMQGAAEQLARLRASRALPHERQALAELKALEKEMQKSCDSGATEGMPLPLGGMAGAGGWDFGGPGGRPEIREVELPAPEDFRPPEQLRRELLEGMKDAVPEGYRPQVRAYYEELVK